MITQGVWVLYMILQIGRYDFILKTYDVFPNQQLCLNSKSDAEKTVRVKMTCLQPEKLVVYDYKQIW